MELVILLNDPYNKACVMGEDWHFSPSRWWRSYFYCRGHVSATTAVPLFRVKWCRTTVQWELPNFRISCLALRTGDCLVPGAKCKLDMQMSYRPTPSLAFHITPDRRAILSLDSQSITRTSCAIFGPTF
jgi:hypothetical protein